MLERRSERRDPVHKEPCRRLEHDPLIDSRWELVNQLVAYPLADLAQPPTGLPPLNGSRHEIANIVTATWLPEHSAQIEQHGVSMVLVLVMGGRVLWADTQALWRRSQRDGVRMALGAQVQHAFKAMADQAGPNQPVHNSLADERAWFRQHWPLRYLPACGLLPSGLIRDVTSHNPRPSVPFFPSSFGVDIATMPISQVEPLIASEICRGPINLTTQQRERVRVAIAVADHDWRPDLLDIPQADASAIQRMVAAGGENLARWEAWRTLQLQIYGCKTMTCSRWMLVFVFLRKRAVNWG